MPLYRHVGTFTQIYDTPYIFKRFGQLADVPDDLASQCKHLIPAADYDAEGITKDEEKRFGEQPGYENPHPTFAAFKVKRDAVWAKAAARWEKLTAPPTQAPATTQEPPAPATPAAESATPATTTEEVKK